MPVTAGKDVRDGLGLHPPGPYFAEGPGQDAHHVVEVSIRGDGDLYFVPFALHSAGRDGPHRVTVGGSGRPRRAQGQEIVFAHKPPGCRVHFGRVQPPGHPGIILLVKRRVDGAVVDAVEIRFGVGRVPGMEILRHHPRRQHPDIRRQVLVEGQRQLFHRDAGVGVEIEHKAQRVDARVGAAAPLDIRAAAQHGLQPILKGLGHAPPVGLHLKPAVVGAIVGKGK